MIRSLTMIVAAILLPMLGTIGAQAAENSGPMIDRAWARATPGSARTGAAYFTIKSARDDRLLGLSSPVARRAELHTHVEENGMMEMRAVEGGLAVSAHQAIELRPGGALHVMLVELNQKLKAGDRFPLILTFEKGGVLDVMVQVEPLGAMGLAGDASVKRSRTPSSTPQ